MKYTVKHMKLLAICLISLGLVGCAATKLAISKRNLEVQTKMSDTIFLEPVADSQKTAYLQIRNTSDKPFNVESRIRSIISSKGYTIVNDPSKAHYILQANVLQVGKIDPSAAEKLLLGGYGSFLQSAGTGAGMGALLGAAAGGNSHSALVGAGIGAVAGGLADTLANALVKDVTYTVITDLQISEKAAKGQKITQDDESYLKQGSSSSSRQTSTHQAGRMKYRTRIMSTANKVNLKFEEALPILEEGLANSIAGVF